ncbi:efflux RND transporter periplasmic adaptor subunit [Capnocytophaga gingivalis]
MKYLLHIFITFLLIACEQSTTDSYQQTVATETFQVTTQTATLTLRYPATLSGVEEVAVLPQLEGKIVKVLVNEGEQVQAGQTLFVIDPVNYRAALATAQANVQAAQAKVANAKLSLESQQELHKQNIVGAITVTQAANVLQTVQAELAQAQAEALRAFNNLSYTEVKSPMKGVIGTLPYKAGALVSPSMAQPLTQIANDNEMIAYFSLGEQQFSALLLQYGSKEKAITQMPALQWQMSNGSTYPTLGKVVTISGILNAQTGSVSVRAAFANPNKLLISGATGNVLMPITFHKALVIPQTAVIQLQDKIMVNLIANGKTTLTEIKVYPINDGKNYIVTEGLQQGDLIATHSE